MTKKKEKGQALPLVALLIFVIIAIGALALDGTFTMYDRRIAQAAADAGALAGARQICNGSTSSQISSVAESYAKQNKATSALALVANNKVSVTATASNGSFFAKLFNQSTLSSTAKASAGCISPSQSSQPKSILPVAWYCKAPVGVPSSSSDCVIHTLSWKNQLEPITKGNQPITPIIDYKNGNTITVSTPLNFETKIIPKYLYVIMDSAAASIDISEGCKSGSLSCLGGGFGSSDRGWLNLDGKSPDAAELSNWISDGFDGTISTHTWYPGSTGTKASVYHSVQEGHVYLVPVFNGTCNDYPVTSDCIKAVDGLNPPIADVTVPGNSNPIYFHVNGFSAFYVSCVKPQGNKSTCPGETIAVAYNPDLKSNDASIEGYFLSDYPGDLDTSGSGGVNVGLSIVSLTE